MSYYLANLILLSPIEVQPPSGKNPPTAILYHKDTPLLAHVPRWLIDKLAQTPKTPQRVTLHPKTDREGILAPTSRLATWGDPKDDEQDKEEAGTLHVVGQVIYIDRDEARLVVRVHPNPKGSLRKSFKLTFQTNLELLEQAPKRGAGVDIKGILKTPSRRLVVTELTSIPLPPIKDATIEKSQAATKPQQKLVGG